MKSVSEKFRKTIVRSLAGMMSALIVSTTLPTSAFAAVSMTLQYDKAYPGEPVRISLQGAGAGSTSLSVDGSVTAYFSANGKTGWTLGSISLPSGSSEAFVRAYAPGNVEVIAKPSNSKAVKSTYQVVEYAKVIFTVDGQKREMTVKITGEDPGASGPGASPKSRRDLAVTKIEVGESSLMDRETGKLPVYVTVKNFGDETESRIDVSMVTMKMGGTELEPWAKNTRSSYSDVSPASRSKSGSQVSFAFAAPLSLSATSADFTASMKNFTDADSTNNEVSAKGLKLPARPAINDLSVALSTVTASAAGKTKARVTIKNLGDAALSPVVTLTAGDVSLGSKRFDSLKAGASSNWDVEFNDPGVAGQKIVLTAALPSSYKDKNNSDNTASTSFLSAAPPPAPKWTVRIAAETAGQNDSSMSMDDHFTKANPVLQGKEMNLIVDAFCEVDGGASDGRTYKIRLYVDGTSVTALKAAEFTCPASAMKNLLTDAKFAATANAPTGKENISFRAEVIEAKSGVVVAKAEKTHPATPSRDLALKVTASGIINPTKVASAVKFELSNDGPRMDQPVKVTYTLGSKKMEKTFSGLKEKGSETWTEDVSFLGGQTVDFTASLDSSFKDNNAANNTAKLAGIKVARWDLALGDLSLGNGGKTDKDGNLTVLVPVRNLSDWPYMLDLKEFQGKSAPTVTVGGKAALLVTKSPFGTLKNNETKVFEFTTKTPDAPTGKGTVSASANLGVGDDVAANNTKSQDLAFTSQALVVEAITAGDVSADGQSQVVTVRVKNQGSENLSNVEMQLLDGSSKLTAERQNIAKGATANFSYNVPLSAAERIANFTTSVGFGGAAAVATSHPPVKATLRAARERRDLAIFIEVKEQTKSMAYFRVTVKNLGQKDETDVRLEIEGGAFNSTRVDKIQKGGQFVWEEDLIAVYSARRPANVTASIARHSDDNNGNNSASITVTSSKIRDFSLQSIEPVDDFAIGADGKMRVKVNLTNEGTTTEGVCNGPIVWIGGDLAGCESKEEFKPKEKGVAVFSFFPPSKSVEAEAVLLRDDNSTNNGGTKKTKAIPLIRDLAISMTTLPQTEAGMARVQLIVKNLGSAAEKDIRVGGDVSKRISSLDPRSEEKWEETVFVKAGESKTVAASLAGTSREAFKDNNSANNSASVQIKGEILNDFALHGIAPVNNFAVGSDGKMRVAVTVSNEGKKEQAPNALLVVTIDGKDAECEDTKVLKTGEKRTVNFKFNPPVNAVAARAYVLRDDNPANNNGSNGLSSNPIPSLWDLALKITASGIITPAKIASAVTFELSNKGPRIDGKVVVNYELGSRKLTKEFSQLAANASETWTEDVGSLAGQTVDFTASLGSTFKDKNDSNNSAKLSGIKVARWDLALGNLSVGNEGKADDAFNLKILVPVTNLGDWPFALDLAQFGGKVAPTLTVDGQPALLLTKAPYGNLAKGQVKVFEFAAKGTPGKNKLSVAATLPVADDDTNNNKKSQELTYQKPKWNIAVTNIDVDVKNGHNNEKGTVKTKVTLTNNGVRTESNIGVRLAIGGTTITPDQKLASLEAGKTAVLEFIVPVGKAVEKKSATASLIDFNDDDATDNSLTKEVTIPNRGKWDLRITDIEPDSGSIDVAKGTMPVDVYIDNPGSRREVGPVIALYVWGKEIARQTAEGPIHPGRQSGAYFKVPLELKPYAVKLKAAFVDYTDDVSDNDSKEVNATLPARALWNLQVESIDVGAVSGGNLPVKITVRNTGGRTESNVPVRLTVDGTASGTDQRIASLGAGKSAEVTFQVPTWTVKSKDLKAILVDQRDDKPEDDSKTLSYRPKSIDVAVTGAEKHAVMPDGTQKCFKYAQWSVDVRVIARTIYGTGPNQYDLKLTENGKDVDANTTEDKRRGSLSTDFKVALLRVPATNTRTRTFTAELINLQDDDVTNNKHTFTMDLPTAAECIAQPSDAQVRIAPSAAPAPYRELNFSSINVGSLTDNSYVPLTVGLENSGSEVAKNVRVQLTMDGKPTVPDQIQTIDSIAPGVTGVQKTFKVPALVPGKYSVKASIVDFTDAQGTVQTADAHPANNVATWDATINSPVASIKKTLAGKLDSSSPSPGSNVKMTCSGFPLQKAGDRVAVGLLNKNPYQLGAVAAKLKDAVQTVKSTYVKPGGNIFSKIKPGVPPTPSDPDFALHVYQMTQDWKEVTDSGAKLQSEEIFNDVVLTIPGDAPKGGYTVFFYYENDPGTQCRADLNVQ